MRVPPRGDYNRIEKPITAKVLVGLDVHARSVLVGQRIKAADAAFKAARWIAGGCEGNVLATLPNECEVG